MCLLASCKKDSPTDPCAGATPLKAKLKVELERSFHGVVWEGIYLDSIFLRGTYPIRFTCENEGGDIAWILGQDRVDNVKSLTRTFDHLPYGTYPVTLIVRQENNGTCFPEDDGVDTVVYNFTTIPICSAAILGDFRGKYESALDSIDIAFDLVTKGAPWDTSCGTDIRMENLIAPDSVEVWGGNYRMHNYGFELDWANGYYSFTADFYPPKNELTIRYRLTSDSSVHVFHGRPLD